MYMWVEVSGEKERCYLKEKQSFGRQDLFYIVVWHFRAKNISQDGCHNDKFRDAEGDKLEEFLLENLFSSVKQEAKILTESSMVGRGEKESGGAETPAIVMTASDSPAGIRN